MEPNLDEFDSEPRLRPTLLTVLCILTFIGSGSTILTNAYSYATASRTVSMFSSDSMKKSDNLQLQKDSNLVSQQDSSGKHWRKNQTTFSPRVIVSLSKILTEENIHKSAIGNITGGICTLFGAVLMWRLLRKGFYLYVLGIVIGIAVPFYLYGNNLLAVGISSFSNFFGLVFIALYALNIKTLR